MKSANEFFNYLDLARAYVRLNWRSNMEYRGAFISQIVAMFLNNSVWVIFWVLFFTRFPVLRGWDVKDVLTIWGVCASGFGLAHGICGNAWYLPSVIARGQLDAWLLYPRAVLPHIILGKMVPTAWGDAIFGYVIYLVFVKPDMVHFALFVLFTLSAAFLFVGFSVLSASLGFWVGNAEILAEQWRFSLITFSTYPSTLFQGAAKLVLFSLIPAGFVSYLPVEALKHLSVEDALLTLAGAFLFVVAGSLAFYAGLRRYESGSALEMRA